MPYREDFYISKNIIGYTGKLHENPTVYFKTQAEYGRITQYHKNKKNIGRNKVRSTASYSYGNEEVERDGEMKTVLVERNGDMVHVSRNEFIEVDQNSAAIAVLMQAIGKFPNIKPKSVDDEKKSE